MKTIEKEIVVQTEDDENVTVDVTFHVEEESDYGADADGNRGIHIAWLEDVEFCAPSTTDDGRILTPEEVHACTSRITKLAHDEDALGLLSQAY
jgi:hypothetical protein